MASPNHPPLSTQKCSLLEFVENGDTDFADGYETKDIDYYWGKKRTDLEITAVKFDTFQLPQFQPTLYFVNTTKAETSSGMS